MTDRGNVKYVGAIQAKEVYVGSAHAANYGDGSAVGLPDIPVDPGTPIPHTFKQAGFPFGLIFKNGQIDNATIRNLMIDEAVVIGAENRLNNSVMRTGQNTLLTTEQDKMAQFAADNGMQFHVPHLLWNTKVPAFITAKESDESLTRDDWKDILKDYIQMPVLHFKQMFVDTGKLQHIAYNVVNEPFRLSETINSTNGTLKDCIWLRKLGAEYIPLALMYAHDADPTALLFVNEFGFEFNWKKLDAMLAFEAKCKTDGVPFHGWGLQLHTGLGQTSNASIEQRMKQLAAGGLLIHISELDISIRQGMPDVYALSDYPAKEAEQASMGAGIFASFLELPKAQQFGITTWGTNDAGSYKVVGQTKSDYPLYFNDQYQHKLVYTESLKVVNAALAS